MWVHLILVNFYFTALIEGWFNTLHNFKIWSYRGHTSPNNTHNNAANVTSISFNSYQFLSGRLGSAFFHLECLRLVSCPLWFSCRLFLPNIFFNSLCSSWYHHQCWNSTFCTFIHCHRASWVEFYFYRLLDCQLDEEYTVVSISIPFVFAQYIIPASSSWHLSAYSLGILKLPQILGMPASMLIWAYPISAVSAQSLYNSLRPACEIGVAVGCCYLCCAWIISPMLLPITLVIFPRRTDQFVMCHSFLWPWILLELLPM